MADVGQLAVYEARDPRYSPREQSREQRKRRNRLRCELSVRLAMSCGDRMAARSTYAVTGVLPATDGQREYRIKHLKKGS
jgi:hypothetical protein